MNKQNCWELKKCGREPGGANVSEFGICPAAEETTMNGVNSGHNGGRICWALVGTYCNGVVQGEFAKKMDNCIMCDVYRTVEKEEQSFVLYPDLMERLNCWEYMKCGRELGRDKANQLGVCPASIDSSTTGLNRGQNGGRICWAIAGTLCGGETQGEFAQKVANCVTCDFYSKVVNEESNFIMYPDSKERSSAEGVSLS